MTLLLVIIIGVIAYITHEQRRSARLIVIGEAMAAATVPFSRQLPVAKIRIAMVGDSTGVGTGASSPAHSIAGLTGAKYPQASIINVAVNGARTAEVIGQINKLVGNFDLILIDVGGNDNVRFTNYNQLEADIQRVLKAATAKSPRILLTTTGNVGTVPLLPWATRWIFAIRSRAIRQLFIDAVDATNGDVRYTDLYRDRSYDPFALDPKKYYARDLFHPSDAGYADWFSFISKKLDEFENID